MQARPGTTVTRENIEHCQPYDFGTIIRVGPGSRLTVQWERTLMRTFFTREDMLAEAQHIPSGFYTDGLQRPTAPHLTPPSASSPNRNRRHRPVSAVVTSTAAPRTGIAAPGVPPGAGNSAVRASSANPRPVPPPINISEEVSESPPRRRSSAEVEGKRLSDGTSEETPESDSSKPSNEHAMHCGPLGSMTSTAIERLRRMEMLLGDAQHQLNTNSCSQGTLCLQPTIGKLREMENVDLKQYPDSVAQDTQMPLIACRAYGVLGRQGPSLEQRGPWPRPETAVVDPLDVQIVHHAPCNATDASQAIYDWCGVAAKDSLPESVRLALCAAPLEAKHHDYGGWHVIHTAVPNLSAKAPENTDDPVAWMQARAVRRLTRAYTSLLREFAVSGLSELRLLPVGGGGHPPCLGGPCPELAPFLPVLTANALRRGFANLDRASRRTIRAKLEVIDMCIFEEKQYDEYRRAFEELQTSREEDAEIADKDDDFAADLPPPPSMFKKEAEAPIAPDAMFAATVHAVDAAVTFQRGRDGHSPPGHRLSLSMPPGSRRRRPSQSPSAPMTRGPNAEEEKEKERKPRNQHLTTEGELWEILAGADATRLAVRAVVAVARRARASGLSTVMRSVLPMRDFTSEFWSPEDMSSGEVEQLCLFVVEDVEVAEQQVRLNLDRIKDTCRRDDADYDEACCSAAHVTAPQFRRVLELIAWIMLVDKEYVVSHFAWCVTRRFEMTDAMASLISVGSRKHRQHNAAPAAAVDSPSADKSAEKLWSAFAEMGMSALEPGMPDNSVLSVPFLARDFQIFAHNSGMIERHGLTGISYGEMVTVYLRVQQRMVQLRDTHAAMRIPACERKQPPRGATLAFEEPEPACASGRRRSLSPRPSAAMRPLSPRQAGRAEEPRIGDQIGLLGRTEIEILFQELWQTGHMSLTYGSPLEMVLCLLQNAGVDKPKSYSDP